VRYALLCSNPGRVGYYYTAFSIAKKTKESRTKNIGLLTLMQGIGFFAKVISCLIAILYLSARLISAESRNYLLLASLVPVPLCNTNSTHSLHKTVNRMIMHIPALRFTLKYITNLQHAVKEVPQKRSSSCSS